MNKGLLLLVASGALVAATATTYYISPAPSVAKDVPPLLVTGRPAAIKEQLGGLEMVDFAGTIAPHRIEGLGQVNVLSSATGDTVQMDFYYLEDHFLVVTAKVTAVNATQSSVDIRATLPADGALTASSHLHPSDPLILAYYADTLATEYFSSVLNRHPMVDPDQMEAAFERELALTPDQTSAFGARLNRAMSSAYEARTKAYIEEMEADRALDDSSDDEPWPEEEPQGPVDLEAERAAMRAEEAAEEAREDAELGEDW